MRILLAEDEPHIRVLVTTILSKKGHTVIEAADGAEALRHLENDTDFDLLITDLRMPNMNGIELIEQVHHRLPELPILVMSAYQTDAEAILAHGIASFLPKPFSYSSLVATLNL